MTPEQQIILQTIGDLWMCCAVSVIIAAIIQAYQDYKAGES